MKFPMNLLFPRLLICKRSFSRRDGKVAPSVAQAKSWPKLQIALAPAEALFLGDLCKEWIENRRTRAKICIKVAFLLKDPERKQVGSGGHFQEQFERIEWRAKFVCYLCLDLDFNLRVKPHQLIKIILVFVQATRRSICHGAWRSCQPRQHQSSLCSGRRPLLLPGLQSGWISSAFGQIEYLW